VSRYHRAAREMSRTLRVASSSPRMPARRMVPREKKNVAANRIVEMARREARRATGVTPEGMKARVML